MAGSSCSCALFLALLVSTATQRAVTWTYERTDRNLWERELAEGSVPYPFDFAEENFTSSVRTSVERLSLDHRPLLVHTRLETDALVFLREDGENFTVSVVSELYSNLQAISHLPVSVAAILAVEMPHTDREIDTLSNDTVAALNALLPVLSRSKETLQENFNDEQQRSRQSAIINTTTQYVNNRLLTSSVRLSLATMETEFGEPLREHLRENARDAVLDYLLCLNKTIEVLLARGNITQLEFARMSVMIDLPEFAEPQSFIVQYYEQLLDYQFQSSTSDTERIILSPSTAAAKRSSSSSLPIETDSPVPNSSIRTLSTSTLTHVVTSTFYGRSNVYSSTHLHLSEAASSVICSNDLTFPSCSDGDSEYNEKLPAGFSNRTERGYVAAIIFVGATCVVLVIVVFCVFHEGEVMRKERQGITIPETRNLVLNNDAGPRSTLSENRPGWQSRSCFSLRLLLQRTSQICPYCHSYVTIITTNLPPSTPPSSGLQFYNNPVLTASPVH